jgi:hypothetical protein
MPIKEVFQALVDIGLVDVVLPFILVFTIVFATLQRTKVFGFENEKKKAPKTKINAMVAFILGFFAVLAANLLNIINIILFYFVLLMIIGLLLALIFGLAGGEGGHRNKLYMAIMLGFAILFFFYALARAGIIDMSTFWSTLFWPLALLALLGYIVYSMFKKKETKNESRPPRGAPSRERQTPPQEEIETPSLEP